MTWLERLLATPGSRIVTVSSVGHMAGEMHFDDLQFERRYNASHADWQSKLANLLWEIAEQLTRVSVSIPAPSAGRGS